MDDTSASPPRLTYEQLQLFAKTYILPVDTPSKRLTEDSHPLDSTSRSFSKITIKSEPEPIEIPGIARIPKVRRSPRKKRQMKRVPALVSGRNVVHKITSPVSRRNRRIKLNKPSSKPKVIGNWTTISWDTIAVYEDRSGRVLISSKAFRFKPSITSISPAASSHSRTSGYPPVSQGLQMKLDDMYSDHMALELQVERLEVQIDEAIPRSISSS